ncbi:MAG: UDP-glucose/GDP-mannose dehydrogenase family protein [Lentisphaerae bacterium]|nr:UDP-glucose/GDP-mannose dehydrogenase family protein [Lentisphaerota bacterium]
MSTIGIIGYGYVGRSVEYGFVDHDRERGLEPKHRAIVYDKYKGPQDLNGLLRESDIIFTCLPTPYDERKLKIDLSIYDEMMAEIGPKLSGKGKVVVIKSTVAPGTTRRYARRYPKVPFAMNPEFLTEASYLQDFVNADRIVVGADNDWVAQKVIDLYRTCFPAVAIVRLSSVAAEIVKYQANVMLAAKVALANVFYDLCQAEKVNYDDVRKAVELDPRIGGSHMDVTTERGFGGKCFPKDLGAIIGCCRELGVDCQLLEAVHAYNLRIRKVRDWHEIAGATVGGRIYGRAKPARKKKRK